MKEKTVQVSNVFATLLFSLCVMSILHTVLCHEDGMNCSPGEKFKRDTSFVRL
jgi:hypothetical protein